MLLHGLEFRLIFQVFLILPLISLGSWNIFTQHGSPAWAVRQGLGTLGKGMQKHSEWVKAYRGVEQKCENPSSKFTEE